MFKPKEINILFSTIIPEIKSIINQINTLQFEEAESAINQLNALFEDSQRSSIDEQVLNDCYIAINFVGLLASCAAYWSLIIKQRFSDSWSALQDSIDLIRTIKKFTIAQPSLILFLEEQLPSLENLYPYNSFLSMGWIIHEEICSICGHSPRSSSCTHISGELYSGKVAHKIAIKGEIDHLSIVKHPKNKRCVITIPDHSKSFSPLASLAKRIINKEFKPLQLATVSIVIINKNNDYKIKYTVDSMLEFFH